MIVFIISPHNHSFCHPIGYFGIWVTVIIKSQSKFLEDKNCHQPQNPTSFDKTDRSHCSKTLKSKISYQHLLVCCSSYIQALKHSFIHAQTSETLKTSYGQKRSFSVRHVLAKNTIDLEGPLVYSSFF